MIFFIIFSLTKHPLKSTLSAAKRKKRKLHGMQCKTTANEFDTISCKKVMQKVLDPQMNYIHTPSHGLQYKKVKALIEESTHRRETHEYDLNYPQSIATTTFKLSLFFILFTHGWIFCFKILYGAFIILVWAVLLYIMFF